MLNKKNYDRIYLDGNYRKYVWNVFTYKLKKYTVDMVNSTILCIRFPFLYPRNRWTGKHWSSWKLDEKQRLIWNKWNDWSKEHVLYYVDKFGSKCVILDNKVVKTEYVMKLASFKDRCLHWWYGFLNKFLAIFHCIPTYTELNAMDKGWRKRFGIQFCKELKHAILKSGGKKYMKDFRITQMKEKWGRFECYVNMYSPEVTRVIEKYGYISKYVCVKCGEDAVKQSLGWISPYCEEHLPKDQKWIWIEPVYCWSNPKHKEENEKILEEIRKC